MVLTAERWSTIRRVYERALEMPRDQRPAYLDDACGADRSLRDEIESLLRVQDQAADFLARPVLDLQANTGWNAADSDRAGQTLGAYRLVAQIGRGGMGEVYRAVRADGQFERQVAIKLIRGGADARLVLEHFRRERQILASLDHPHIAQLYDAGATTDGLPYLVIEYVDGVPIDRFADERNPSLHTLLEIFADVCDTVQFAHQRLIVHRDLKPANILVSADGDVKLLDFGIAKVLGDPGGGVEMTQALLMTPAFASPEQIRGEAITTVSDVYSLGVLLYRLLTGRSPYGKATLNPHALAIEICEREPQSFAAERWRVPRDLEMIARWALRKAPNERYASVEQLSADIRRFLEGVPVQAVKGSASYRARKFIVRNRTSVAAAAIAALLTVAGIAEIVRQRQLAERRFNDVRQLTNTVIFDVHDAIAEIPGATPARKLILDRAMQYLERLNRDNNSSIELQREIASSYERIALVQGATAAANLGDLDGAESNHRRVLALRQRIVARRPDDLGDRIALARANRLLAAFEYSARADIVRALALSQVALNISEPLASQFPDDTVLLTEMAEDQLLRVRVLGGVGVGNDARRPQDALRMLARVDQTLGRLGTLMPADLGVRRKIAISAAMAGNISFRLGNRSVALDNFERARSIFAQLATQSAQTGDRRNAAFFGFRAGIVLLANGDPQESLERCTAAWRAARDLLAADPANKDILDISINSEACMGHALSHLGQHRDAIDQLARAVGAYKDLAKSVSYEALPMSIAVIEAWYARALELGGDLRASRQSWRGVLKTYEDVLARDANNADAAVNRAAVEGALAHVSLRLGDVDAAARHIVSALSALGRLRARQPDYLELEYLEAQASAGMGDVVAAGRTPSAAAEARVWYAKSLSAWARIASPGRLSITGMDVYAPPDAVARKLD